MSVIDLAKIRRKAAGAKKSNDADFVRFCEAVGTLSRLQHRGRSAAEYAGRLDMDDVVASARAFLADAQGDGGDVV